MKKLIAAIVIASMGAAFAAEVPTIVYDYKASIKRLDLQLKFVKKASAVTQSFKVVSDTIQGYVTLPLCDNCLPADQTGIDSTDGVDFNGSAYLTLKGNKYAKDYKRVVLKTPAYANAAVFGSEAWVSSTQPIDPKKNTKAWMALDYNMPAIGARLVEDVNAAWPDFDISPVLKNQISIIDPVTGKPDYLYLDFLGIGHVGNLGIAVQNTGFGTAKVVTTKTPGSASLCGGYVSGQEYNCTIVNTISGTLVGYPWYLGACGHIPMWDVCVADVTTTDATTGATTTTKQYKPVIDSVISGTWNLKYNNKLSDEANKEAAILKALKASASEMYEIGDDGYLKKATSGSY